MHQKMRGRAMKLFCWWPKDGSIEGKIVAVSFIDKPRSINHLFLFTEILSSFVFPLLLPLISCQLIVLPKSEKIQKVIQNVQLVPKKSPNCAKKASQLCPISVQKASKERPKSPNKCPKRKKASKRRQKHFQNPPRSG